MFDLNLSLVLVGNCSDDLDVDELNSGNEEGDRVGEGSQVGERLRR